MYSFIDKDKKQVDIKEEDFENALKMSDDFRKYGRGLKLSEFHKKRTEYWEDFYYQLNKLKKN